MTLCVFRNVRALVRFLSLFLLLVKMLNRNARSICVRNMSGELFALEICTREERTMNDVQFIIARIIISVGIIATTRRKLAAQGKNPLIVQVNFFVYSLARTLGQAPSVAVHLKYSSPIRHWTSVVGCNRITFDHTSSTHTHLIFAPPQNAKVTTIKLFHT